MEVYDKIFLLWRVASKLVLGWCRLCIWTCWCNSLGLVDPSQFLHLSLRLVHPRLHQYQSYSLSAFRVGVLRCITKRIYSNGGCSDSWLLPPQRTDMSPLYSIVLWETASTALAHHANPLVAYRPQSGLVFGLVNAIVQFVWKHQSGFYNLLGVWYSPACTKVNITWRVHSKLGTEGGDRTISTHMFNVLFLGWWLLSAPACHGNSRTL